MAENQNLVPNLSEMMDEYAHGEEEVHLEPQPGKVITEELEAQPEVGEPAEEGRKAKGQRSVRHNEEAEPEGDKDFVSVEAYALWNKLFADKGFINKRGFGKLISPFFGNNRKREVGISSTSTRRLASLLWQENFTQIWWR